MLIIFDLETTCWQPSQKDNISEIIEIGAIRYDIKNNKIESTIKFFVKPIINSTLSKYCKDKTRIKQSDIDCGLSFIFAMEKFNRWIHDGDIIMSWGTFNKNQIKRESFLKAYNGDLLDKVNKNYRNLKRDFMDTFNMKNDIGMKNALSACDIKTNGKSGVLTDSENILKIFEVIKDKLKKQI